VRKAEVEDEGEVEVEMEALGILRCFFSLSSPSLYPPAPHFWIFIPNFAIHHDNSEVSAFISNTTAVHRTLSAPHRLPIPCTSESWDEILEGGILLHPITLT